MRILRFDKKAGELKLLPENIEDLWHLEKVLNVGDRVSADSLRTVRVGTKEEKRHVFITLIAEDFEFADAANRLRIRGKIVAGSPEDFVQLGRYHTIDVEIQTKLTVVKEWKSWQIERLKEAEKETKRPRLRIIVLDDEKAITAIVSGRGVDYGAEIHSNARKRGSEYEAEMARYLGEVAAEIERHPEKYIVAGPGFTKDNLKEFIKKKKPELLERIVFESCSYAERSGVNELFSKGVVERLAGKERLAIEMKLLEEFLAELHKDSGFAVYGIEEVKAAAEASAIKDLLILDELLRTSPEAEEIMEMAAKQRAHILIFSGESDGGARLKGLAKIAAILKFKLR